jgi:hypothetical protein
VHAEGTAIGVSFHHEVQQVLIARDQELRRNRDGEVKNVLVIGVARVREHGRDFCLQAGLAPDASEVGFDLIVSQEGKAPADAGVGQHVFKFRKTFGAHGEEELVLRDQTQARATRSLGLSAPPGAG